MHNVKINQINPVVIQESDFHNKLSYRRFMKGFERAVEIQELKDSGYLIFIDGQPMSPEENFIFGDMRDKPCFGTGDDRCMSIWLGSTFDPVSNNIYVEKEEMGIFNTVTYVSPKHIKKMRKV